MGTKDLVIRPKKKKKKKKREKDPIAGVSVTWVGARKREGILVMVRVRICGLRSCYLGQNKGDNGFK